jgi:hypothetical protein
VLSLTKGLEVATFRRPTEIIEEVLGTRPLGVLSGPSHAEEVARGLPTTLVAASADADLARWVQRQFSTERFRVYTNQDLVGVELAGALKNIIGIAAGISDGLGFGDNAKSALMTRGLAEMVCFGVAWEASADVLGPGGHGRPHHHVRQRTAATGRWGCVWAKPAAILASMTMVAEVLAQRARKAQQMPCRLPRRSLSALRGRDPRQAVQICAGGEGRMTGLASTHHDGSCVKEPHK